MTPRPTKTNQRQPEKHSRWALLTIVALLAASCSSTTTVSTFTAPASNPTATAEPDALALHTSPTADGTTGSPMVNATGSPRKTSGDDVATSTAPASRPASPATAIQPRALPAGRDTPGVTHAEIWLGFQTVDPQAFQAAAIALGLNSTAGESDIDFQTAVEAVIGYVNRRGGLGGRTIRPIYHEVNMANAPTSDGRARDAQTACARYSEDNEVFAYYDGGMWTEDNMTQCAADNHMVHVSLGIYGNLVSSSRYQQLRPYYLAPDRFLTNHHDRLMVERLVAEGLLPTDAKVGLLTDARARESTEGDLKPGLARHGIEVVAEAAYPDVIESPWDTYVLQFRSAGVTHVLFGTSSYGFWPLQNMIRANENQAWYPKMLGTSEAAPGRQQAYASPETQLENIGGVGFSGYGDLSTPGGWEQAPSPRCRAAIEEAGLGEDNAAVATYICSFVFLLVDGIAGASELSAEGLAKALPHIDATPYTQATKTRFRPGRPDGAASLQPFAWNPDCGCFAYTGPAVDVD